ncbi:MAG: ankyrin repeat domain-containing protein [Alphaproteobacteria bacterium]
MYNIYKIIKDFHDAVWKGDLKKINQILNKSASIVSNEEYDAIIHDGQDFAFWWLALKGHINVMDNLLALTPDDNKRETMIHANNDCAFIYAASGGHINIINKLLALTPDPNKCYKMIHENNDDAVICAIRNGHIDCFIYLCSLVYIGAISNIVKKSLERISETRYSSKDLRNLILTYLNDVEGIKSLVSIYSSLVKEHNWPISKLKPVRKLINEISNFMQVSKDPFNNMQVADDSKPADFINFVKKRDMLTSILYQSSSVKDELSFQEAVTIIKAMEETRIETLASVQEKPKYNIVKAHTSFVEKFKDKLPKVRAK